MALSDDQRFAMYTAEEIGNASGTYNADFCLFMENWMNKLAALQSGSISQEQFETWKRETLEYYSDSFFSDFSSQREKAKKSKGAKRKVRERPVSKASQTYSYYSNSLPSSLFQLLW